MSGARVDDGDPTQAASASEASVPRRPAVELASGTHVGRYIVLDRLGAGGMGVVYAAFDPSLDRKVAIKLLRHRSDGSQGTSARGRLLREARAMAQLRSPNVVTVYDVGEHDGHIYVAMEFIEGITLRRWLREVSRPWREVLDTFLMAGRGLAAAHACGIVHRDFKPDNVMLLHADAKTPANERVRVMDFGLARPVGGNDIVRPVELTPMSADASLELTRDGAIVGTPGYMAPEQHGAGPATAAADQFSFCVALWEALYGQRPFTGESPTEIAIAVQRGEVRAPPPGSRVPAWVRLVVERGLAVQPSDRWESLDVLLRALERDPTQRRRKVWALVAALGLTAAGYGIVEAFAARREAACEATGSELAEVWNEAVAEDLQQRFTAAGDDGTSFPRTRKWIDAEADAWRTARIEVCRASEIEARFDAATTERAQACLDEHRGRLASLLDAFAAVDASSLRLTVLAAADLPRADACTDTRALPLRAPQPADEATRAAAAEVRAEIWRASAVGLTINGERALAILDATDERARALDNVPLLIELRLQQAHRLSGVGRYADAEARLHEALLLALEARDAPSAIRSAAGLSFLVGYQMRRLQEGLRWGRMALAMLHALPDPPASEQIVVLRNLAVLEFMNGDHASAITTFEEVLALQTGLLGEEHPDIANALHNLAAAHSGMDDVERAREMYERELAVVESQLGPNDIAVAPPLQGLAMLAAKAGHHDEALALLLRSLVIEKATHGADHPIVAESLCRLGEVEMHRAEPAQALDYHRRALAIEEQQGADDLRLLRPLVGVATAELELGHVDEAVHAASRALDLATAKQQGGYEMATVHFVYARARWAADIDRPGAVALARNALAETKAHGMPAATLSTDIEAWLADK
jgi:tetratricopeptide (TPR) repeat protein